MTLTLDNRALFTGWRHGGDLQSTNLTTYLSVLTLTSLLWTFYIKSLRPKKLTRQIKDLGVAVSRIRRAIQEIERKTFHLCGLLVPLIYQLLLNRGYSWSFCSNLCWVLTGAGWAFDLARLNSPAVREVFMKTPIGAILREKEQDQMSGACFFSLGCTLAIACFPPAIAMTSILFLVLGDMMAALIGVSFGGDICVVKLGREGKKSAEGSVAMFATCVGVGLISFSAVNLSEYAVVVAALAATVTELYEPFGLNDNLTIPMITSLALSWGFQRTSGL
jgi:dolichol kinase